MGLRSVAEADLAFTLEDDVNGFAWPITVTDPAGTVGSLTGASGDIGQLIDPDTGAAVSGRLAHVSLRIATLTAKGLAIPENITESSLKPWIVAFDDINGNSYTFKVMQSNPDRTLGLVTCVLEVYAP